MRKKFFSLGAFGLAVFLGVSSVSATELSEAQKKELVNEATKQLPKALDKMLETAWFCDTLVEGEDYDTYRETTELMFKGFGLEDAAIKDFITKREATYRARCADRKSGNCWRVYFDNQKGTLEEGKKDCQLALKLAVGQVSVLYDFITGKRTS